MISRRTFLALMAGLAGGPAAWAQQESETAQMAALATAFMRQYRVPGMSIAIAVDGQMVYTEGFGLADTDNQVRVTPQHQFRIASISKPFTSTTIMRLMETGRLRLSKRVFGPESILGTDFGADFKQWVTDITVEHLLTHTGGGWPNDGTDPMFKNPGMNERELIAWAIDTIPLTHPPGTHFAYSNFGYCVLGRVIEKVTGLPYEAAARTYVLEPCGITSMQIGNNRPVERQPMEVVYYGQGGDRPYAPNVRRMDSHGGWIASAPDLVNFLLRVDGFPSVPDILSPETLRIMTTATAANPGYAKGFAVNRANNWWHNGSLPGTSTIMVRTARGMCWAALTNTRSEGNMGGDLDNLIWKMVRKVRSWPA